MFSFVRRRTFLLLVGLLLIAVFVWFAGPYFAFADYAPLETERARLIAIALVVALAGLRLMLTRLRADRASDKLAAAVLSQAPAEQGQPSAEALKLRERFEEAVATLKQQRRSGHSLYDLPWYMFIGAPGSGKTTALLNSGLKFPLEHRVGKGALRGVGGTRNCDWWFTDQAVFLDTAGRYLTQDSDATSDRAGWEEFLALLRHYRKRRPVNGVILTISTEDLLKQGAAARDAHAEVARRRLTELIRELRIQLPVYVMVTKCDLVAGFSEYFDDLAQDGRAQVWGVTFPYEQTLKGQATQVFPGEFETLIARLNDRLLARLEEEREPGRRTRVFAFPQQMATLRDLLASWIGEVFASTRFEQQILLRGVYFTSGTQDGTQIDRLLGAIGRRFGLAPEAVAPPVGRGKAYFVERLLKEVLIGESGLAGVNRRLEVQKAALQLGAYVAMTLVAVVTVVAWSLSYGRNRTYVGEVAADIAALRAVPSAPPGAPLDMLLPRLDAVRAVFASADRYGDNVPWSMRWGLYQGASVGKSAQDAYVRELDGMLLPRLAARLKQRLIEYAAEPEKLYVYLKAYLMLGEPRHLDRAHLQFLADLEWGAAGQAAGTPVSQHFKSLLDHGGTLRPIALDASLVAQARSTIRRASIPRIMYNELKQTYQNDPTRAVRLDVAAGVGVEQVLRRKSGTSLSEPVPSLYGRAAFNEVTGRGVIELVKQVTEDDWVWGAERLSTDNPVTIAGAVIGVYEQDYITAWDGILNDLELVPFSTVAQAAEALRILGGPTSPLRGLLRTVVENTSLIEAPASGQPAGALSSAGKAVTDRLGRILKPIKDAAGVPTPGALVTAHFQPLRQLLEGAPGNTPLDGILARINQVQQALNDLGPAVGETSALEVVKSQALRGLLQSLRQEAEPLPPVVRSLIAQLGHLAESRVIEEGTGELEARYEREVLSECNRVITGRYPFAAGAASEVPLADFGRVFGHGGVFDLFFRNSLEPLVDTSRSPWTWRPGSVNASREMLARFEAAHRVREMFFRPGEQVPALAFTVMLGDLDASSLRFVLDVDGQRYEDRRGPARASPVVWPGRSPGEAVATFEDRFGTWPTLKFVGPWAWFRLIDAAEPRRESDLRLGLGFQNSGRRARVTVEASTQQNPFTNRGWQRFRCES